MRRIIFFIFIGIVILIAAGFYYRYEAAEKKDHLLLYGNVDVRQVDLSFRVSGRLTALFFEEGDFVPRGKLVGVLDKQPYEDEIRQAAASVESIKTSLKNAEKVLKRRQDLIGDGSVSQEDLDNALSNKEVLSANLGEAEAALSIAKTNLKFTEVYSPSDGTVLTRIREPGSVVNPTNPICTLSIIHPLWIRAYVHEKELGLIYPGMEAQVFTDTNPDKPYKGRIGFISPQAEFTPKTVETTQLRTDLVYRLRIYVDHSDNQLRQGMPVTVKLPLPKEDV
jgi:HlyD family secretion protein